MIMTAVQPFFTYNPDGTAEISLIGRSAKLRRPKVGEIRELRQMWEAEADAPDEDIDALRVEIEQMRAVNGTNVDDEFIERLNAFRARSKRVRDRNEDLRVMWLTAVLQTLDEAQRTPSEEEFPGDVLRGTWPRDLINHWLGGGLPFDSDSGLSES